MITQIKGSPIMDSIMRLGFVFLGLASVASFFHLFTDVAPKFIHATRGFFYGLSVVFLLFGLARTRKRDKANKESQS